MEKSHGTNNASAIVLGSVFSASAKDGIPLWMHFIGFAGLAAVLLLLRYVRNSDSGEEAEQNEITYNAAVSDCTIYKSAFPVKSAVFLGLSLLLLASAGVAEILVRMGIINLT